MIFTVQCVEKVKEGLGIMDSILQCPSVDVFQIHCPRNKNVK